MIDDDLKNLTDDPRWRQFDRRLFIRKDVRKGVAAATNIKPHANYRLFVEDLERLINGERTGSVDQIFVVAMEGERLRQARPVSRQEGS